MIYSKLAGVEHFIPPSKRSRGKLLIWALSLPFASLIGNNKLNKLAKNSNGPLGPTYLQGKKVLIVGTGPSFDSIDSEFFDDYDEIFAVNFAVTNFQNSENVSFFTTDVGVLINMLCECGAELFSERGSQRAIVAPICFEQLNAFPKYYSDLFTWLKPNASVIRLEKVKRKDFPVITGLPYTMRLYPRQIPNVALTLGAEPTSGKLKEIPILEHTSALSAICLAATCGAREIDLIGCEFSSGRSEKTTTPQPVPAEGTFSGAIDSFQYISVALHKVGCTVRNLSWHMGDR